MENLEESKPTCPVCLEPGQNLCHLQPCQHEFCQNCVASLTEQNPEFLCPLCRTPVKNTKKYWTWTTLRKWVCCLVILIVFAGIFAMLWFHNPKWQEVKTSWNSFCASEFLSFHVLSLGVNLCLGCGGLATLRSHTNNLCCGTQMS